EDWQAKILRDMGEHIRENATLSGIGLDMDVWRSATTSGHGVGKSALVAWIIYFLMSTRRDTRGVVTANTQNQLEGKTWPELAKWHNLAINKHWFTWTATQFYFSQYDEDRRKNYMVEALTVSEQKTEAFAGLHNEGKTVFAVFDEASGIFPKIWEVVDGALTDGDAFFFAFGNPTRPDGEFADCFDKHKHMYHLYEVDSRSVSHTNKKALQDIIEKYGADSDEARIRVYGKFPRMSYNGFIS
ncbi:MAG: terminase, partial [Tepidimonas sp.]